MAILLITSGGVLFSLGMVAEYLGVVGRSAMGKPLYLVVTDPAEGPLGVDGPAPRSEQANTPPASVDQLRQES
jgi:undecaprenyl-phosphate 4-deoxy-4-formamido-L-arabinose transferase